VRNNLSDLCKSLLLVIIAFALIGALLFAAFKLQNINSGEPTVTEQENALQSLGVDPVELSVGDCVLVTNADLSRQHYVYVTGVSEEFIKFNIQSAINMWRLDIEVKAKPQTVLIKTSYLDFEIVKFDAENQTVTLKTN